VLRVSDPADVTSRPTVAAPGTGLSGVFFLDHVVHECAAKWGWGLQPANVFAYHRLPRHQAQHNVLSW